MPSRSIRVAAIAIVAAALIAGALTFPGALEPGRSERDGITLETALGTGNWFPGSAETLITPRRPAGVTLESHRRGLLLVSRGLAVEPDRCYSARLRARAAVRGIRLGVFTERLDEAVAIAPLPPSAGPVEHDLRFAADGRRRVSIAILGSVGAKAAVIRLVLSPRPC